MSDMRYEDMDLSKISMCIKRLCGRIAAPGPPTCDEKEDCPGKWWKLTNIPGFIFEKDPDKEK